MTDQTFTLILEVAIGIMMMGLAYAFVVARPDGRSRMFFSAIGLHPLVAFVMVLALMHPRFWSLAILAMTAIGILHRAARTGLTMRQSIAYLRGRMDLNGTPISSKAADA